MDPTKVKKGWSTEDFDQMSWHDNPVYSIRFDADSDVYRSDLVLDIDYIVEWSREGDLFRFWISPATLTFHSVYQMKMELCWEGCQMEMSIHEITRSGAANPSYSKWVIGVNWPMPGGQLAFESTGFTQTLRAEPVLCDGQHFPSDRRQAFALIL